MLNTNNTTYLKSCQFGPKSPYCPIFRLGSVVSWTGSSFQEIAKKVGGARSGSPPWGPKGSARRRVCGGDPWGGLALQSHLPQGLPVFRTCCACTRTSGTR